MNTSRITAVVLFFGLLAASGSAFAVEPSRAEPTTEKVVYHVDESVNAEWAMMLARGHLDVNDKAHIVFVTYGPGVDFLLKGAKNARGNEYANSVETLMLRGVEFRLCAATLEARGIDRKKVIDGVTLVPAGAYEVARLQAHEGYVYLKP